MTPEDRIDNANHRLPDTVHYMVEVDYWTDHGARLDIVQQTTGSVVVEGLGYRDVCEALEEYHLEQLAAVRAAKILKPTTI